MMLSDAELAAIGLTGFVTQAPIIGHYRLDGIIYHSDEDWLIWLNGEMFSTDNPPPHFTIIVVTPHYIDIKSIKNPQGKSQRIGINQSVKL